MHIGLPNKYQLLWKITFTTMTSELFTAYLHVDRQRIEIVAIVFFENNTLIMVKLFLSSYVMI